MIHPTSSPGVMAHFNTCAHSQTCTRTDTSTHQHTSSRVMCVCAGVGPALNESLHRRTDFWECDERLCMCMHECVCRGIGEGCQYVILCCVNRPSKWRWMHVPVSVCQYGHGYMCVGEHPRLHEQDSVYRAANVQSP